MALKIAFLGYNVRHTGMSMMRFAADNAAQVERYERYSGHMLLTDGTKITAISNYPLIIPENGYVITGSEEKLGHLKLGKKV